MANREIVGWFYRNGKRIPIFEKSGSVDKKYGVTTARTHAGQRAKIAKDIGNAMSKAGQVTEAQNEALFNHLYDETKANRAQIRKNVKARDLKGRPLPLQNVSEGPMDRAHARAEVRNTGRVIEDPKGNQYRPLKRTGIQNETKLNNQLPGDQTMSDIRAGNYGKKAGTGRRTKIKDRALERKYQNEARSNTIKNIARIDAGLSNGGVMMDKAKAREKRDRLEASLKSDFYKPRPSNVKRGEGNARTKSGWSKPSSPFPGAGEDYQTLYKGGKKKGRVLGWDDDGAYGYNAQDKSKKTIGNFKTREEAQKAVEKEATIKKPVATGKGSLRQTDNSEMRRRMWGTPGVPGKEKPTLDIRGKRRSSYDIPQRRAFAGKPIEESYIKYVMKEYGFSRADAIKLIKDKREGK